MPTTDIANPASSARRLAVAAWDAEQARHGGGVPPWRCAQWGTYAHMIIGPPAGVHATLAVIRREAWREPGFLESRPPLQARRFRPTQPAAALHRSAQPRRTIPPQVAETGFRWR